MANGLARRALFMVLRRLRAGRIEIVEGKRTYAFGPLGSELTARVKVHDPRAYRWVLRGSTGLGEGYIERLWSSDDLVTLIRIGARAMPTLDRVRRPFRLPLLAAQRLVRMVPRNTRAGAARNISAHYDLGNELFTAFLGERMQYSSARFDDPKATLEDAQLAKLERICEALDLGPDDHLLEIGTGWGGLAIHAATTRGCRVTTTTISREQHAYATELVHEAGLADRVDVLFTDYRDLKGHYDKLVSIEMIEAVGWQYFNVFFEKCSALLRPGGLFFLQAIVMADEAYELEKASRTFANTHVFPGGCLPSEGLIKRLGAASALPVESVDDITASYARTLELWRARFNDAFPRLRSLGYDDRFARLWNFYLGSSEAGFRERRIRDLQIVLAKAGTKSEPLESSRWRSRTRERAPVPLSS
jgi:cyclopropane-fatty-acyl-phospholipid synthase